MRIVVLDTETTGLDPKESAVVEYAWAVVDTETMRVGPLKSALCDPGHPIPPEARSVHHISDEEVRGKPSLERLLGGMDFSNVDAFCAHNAEYDQGFVGPLVPADKPWICTMRCAKHVWPDAPKYGNQVLRYWLGIEPDFTTLPVAQRLPHRAGYDVACTANILLRLLSSYSGEQLVQFTREPVLLKTVHFGKHRGQLWAEVPRDYLRWMARQPDMLNDIDVGHTVRTLMEA